MTNVTFNIPFDKLAARLKQAGKSLDATVVRRISRPAAKRVQAAARGILAGHERTGTLVDAIGLINGKSSTSPAILVGPMAKKRAFHAHLVEEGTKERFPKKKKYLRFKDADGNWVTANSVAPMPALHFMKRAMEKSQDAVRKEYEKGLTRELRKLDKEVIK